MKCGLLGRKLGHSYSPQIHRCFGAYSYELFEKEPEEVADFLKNGDFTGINVTVPYKKDVMPHLDSLTEQAKRLGAVNTVLRKNGKLIGHNTDYFGFQTMLTASGLQVRNKKALVLGSGGASNTAVAVLQEAGADVVVISRTGENHYGNLEKHSDAAVIVNTTPVGMYPNTGVAPLKLDAFDHLEGVLDVVYNPARTKLLLDAEKRGIVAMNGLLMLVAQAKEAAQRFTDAAIDSEKIHEVYRILQKDMENIILIGMPGCGKSTIGKRLAQQLGKEFVDADDLVVQLAGCSIPEIFATQGEEAFRSLETQALEVLGKRSGLIIATGGGCVTKERNYPLLHQNGRIFWLTRAIEALPTQGRPLSQTQKLAQMYEIRKPLYQRFADHTVSNDGPVEDTIAQILEEWT